MLNYHLLWPQQSKHNDSHYHHYLGVGSHLSPYDLGQLVGLSIVTLLPMNHLPTLSNNQQDRYETSILPLAGCLKLDGVIYDESISTSLMNIKDITNANQDTKINSTFVYIVYLKLHQGFKLSQRIKMQRVKQSISFIELEKEVVYVWRGKLTLVNEQVTIEHQEDQIQPVPAVLVNNRQYCQVAANSTLIRISLQ